MLGKGCYTLEDNASLAVYCCKPAYLGLQDALSFHNLWEQETVPVIITSRKIRQGIRSILGSNVLLHRVHTKYLFGFEYHQEGKFYLPYSDVEKTFIDMLYFKENINKETLHNFKKKINQQKLCSYLKCYPIKFRKRVLGLF